MMKDCYGYDANPEMTFRKDKKPYQIDSSNGTTYLRFDAADICAIHKITVQGTVTTITWAYGAWADRATLTYDKTLNETISY